MTSFAALRPARRRAVPVLSASVALALLVAGSALVRTVLALERAAHRYVPDEFLYGQLARSLAEGDGVRVLGEPARLPSIVQPLVTAPTWFANDAELAFRLTQTLHATAMSLAAVPVYLIARTLGLGRLLCTAGAVAAVVSPDLVYSGYVTADAIGYTLTLVAVLLGLRMLARPTGGAQLLFLAVSGLAAATRLQYAVLVPAVFVAGLVVERGRLRVVTHRYRFLLAALALAGLALTVAGNGLLGRYGALRDGEISWAALLWVANSAFLLTLACGVVVVPTALAWIGAELRRPTDRPAVAFAAFLTTLSAALLLLSALVGLQSGSPRFFERYLMVLVPLAFVAFATGIRAGVTRTVPVAAAVVLAVALALVPISEFSAGQGRADSPFLLGVSVLEQAIGVGPAGLVVAFGGTLAALVGLLAALGRLSTAPTIGITLAILGALSIGAHAADVGLSRNVSRSVLGPTPGWIDATGLRSVLLVQGPRGDAADAMITALRNTSVSAATTLGRVDRPIDGTRRPLRVLPNGALRMDGRPVRRPLVVVSRRSRVVFEGGPPIATSPVAALYRDQREHRLAAIIEGLAPNGSLASAGRVVVFAASRPQCLRLRLTVRSGGPRYLRLDRGFGSQVATVRPDSPATIVLDKKRRQEAAFAVTGGVGIRATAGVVSCNRR